MCVEDIKWRKKNILWTIISAASVLLIVFIVFFFTSRSAGNNIETDAIQLYRQCSEELARINKFKGNTSKLLQPETSAEELADHIAHYYYLKEEIAGQYARADWQHIALTGIESMRRDYLAEVYTADADLSETDISLADSFETAFPEFKASEIIIEMIKANDWQSFAEMLASSFETEDPGGSEARLWRAVASLKCEPVVSEPMYLLLRDRYIYGKNDAETVYRSDNGLCAPDKGSREHFYEIALKSCILMSVCVVFMEVRRFFYEYRQGTDGLRRSWPVKSAELRLAEYLYSALWIAAASLAICFATYAAGFLFLPTDSAFELLYVQLFFGKAVCCVNYAICPLASAVVSLVSGMTMLFLTSLISSFIKNEAAAGFVSLIPAVTICYLWLT